MYMEKMESNAIKVMKLNVLDTHDRYLELMKNFSNIMSQGCEDCLKKNPLSLALQAKSPYIYIFAHPRTGSDGATKTMYWQPRLSKPKAQSNSYLFRCISRTDIVKTIWMIPNEETWGQHNKGNVTEQNIVRESIWRFIFERKELETPDPDDLPEQAAKAIMRDVIKQHKTTLKQKKILPE